MALIFITADDKDGFDSSTAGTDVFVKAGVLLGVSIGTALDLEATGHDVTVQGAVIGDSVGIKMGPASDSTVANCTLSIAEGGLVVGGTAASLTGPGNHVTNNGDILGRNFGLVLDGDEGTSTVENFGLISANSEAIAVGAVDTQAVTLRNTGQIAGSAAYEGGAGVDTIVNQGVMNGSIALGSGNDAYRGGLGTLDGSVNGGSGSDQIICGVDDDSLNGGADSDTLKGGGGEDQFYFTTTLGPSNVDTIRDFRPADDTILLENAVFTQIVGTGKLSGAQFATSASGVAAQADDRIVYETDTGRLFYDSNGSEAGGRTLFAVLAGAPAITAADFSVF